MSKIIPQIIFSKEKFEYGKDVNIEGVIALPGVDLGTIKSISIDHVVWYGISGNKKKPLEGFNHSSKKDICSINVPLETLSFSFPLTLPNIKKTDGASLDGNYSLIQNNVHVSIKEHSFFSLEDHENTIIPIEWPVLSDDTINNKDLRDIFEDVEDDEKDEGEDKNDIEEIKTIPQGSIALPWNDMDFVSEVYYKNIIDSKLFAKLGDVFYKNTVLKTMRIGAIFGFVLSIVLIVVSGNDFSIKTQNTLLEIGLILIYLCPLYLGLQAIPKFYLKKKISIDSYLPKIQSSEVLYNSLVSDLFSIKDIFQTIDFQPSSPLIGQSGSIILNFDLSCTYTYQSGKHSHTHEQMLLNGVIYDMPFSSFEASLNKGVTVPNWVIEALKISDDYNIGLKKRITINLILDNLPDKEYNLILKAPVTP